MEALIHQIFYSERTRAENDPGFLPLDYLDNARPDWREYWPIRRWLATNAVDEATPVGFLSPKFRQKTGLDAAALHRFVADADADVCLISPFFDQSALFLNVFEQAGVQHPGIADTLARAAALVETASLGPVDEHVGPAVMDSTNTVFCNFIVARPRFWRAWLVACERIFAVAEAGGSDLATALNAPVGHLGGAAPVKVFMIERVASLLLAGPHDFKVRSLDPMRLPFGLPKLVPFTGDLCTLDALKIAHRAQPHPGYLAQFSALRQSILQRLSAA